jgi:hypothetical protein
MCKYKIINYYVFINIIVSVNSIKTMKHKGESSKSLKLFPN